MTNDEIRAQLKVRLDELLERRIVRDFRIDNTRNQTTMFVTCTHGHDFTFFTSRVVLGYDTINFGLTRDVNDKIVDRMWTSPSISKSYVQFDDLPRDLFDGLVVPADGRCYYCGGFDVQERRYDFLGDEQTRSRSGR